MIHAHESNDDQLTPAYAGRLNQQPTPKNRIPAGESPPTAVYRFIHDELLLDGSSRLNMATFVTTWMEPEADKLMAESFDKNMIDKDEYPQTAEIERRCVNVVADLFHPGRDGAGALYTREHFAAVRELLTEGGLFCQWLPLYQLDPVSYTHLTLPTTCNLCRSRWSPYH